MCKNDFRSLKPRLKLGKNIPIFSNGVLRRTKQTKWRTLTDSSLTYDPGESEEQHDAPDVEKTSHLQESQEQSQVQEQSQEQQKSQEQPQEQSQEQYQTTHRNAVSGQTT